MIAHQYTHGKGCLRMVKLFWSLASTTLRHVRQVFSHPIKRFWHTWLCSAVWSDFTAVYHLRNWKVPKLESRPSQRFHWPWPWKKIIFWSLDCDLLLFLGFIILVFLLLQITNFTTVVSCPGRYIKARYSRQSNIVMKYFLAKNHFDP